MDVCDRGSHKTDFYVHYNIFTIVDVEIQKYSSKCKRTRQRHPEQQMTFSANTSVSVSEPHGVL